MGEIAIWAEGLSKRYRMGEQERYTALRDVLARSLRAPWTLFRRASHETFWALKDVDLEVKHGVCARADRKERLRENHAPENP